MIDGLIRWSLRHRPIVVALAAAFLIWGGWTATRIPLDVLPDLTAPTVTILTEAPGMDPLEIESLVTFPIESALNGAAGVRRVRSATAVGVAVVWVEFDWGQDINRARQTVTEKLTLVSGSLPPDVEPPFLAPVSSIMGEVLFIDLESDRHSPLELRTVGRNGRPAAAAGRSRRLAGDRDRWRAEAVRGRARSGAPGGAPGHARRGRAGADCRQPERDGRLPGVAGTGIPGARRRPARRHRRHRRGQRQGHRGGASAHPRHRHRSAKAQRSSAAKAHTMPGPPVIVGIQKQPAVNTLELTERIDATLDDIQRALPPGMQIHRDLFRQADFIEQSLDNLFRALLEGAGLVILVVVVFLMNMRAAIITLLALPLSLVAAVIAHGPLRPDDQQHEPRRARDRHRRARRRRHHRRGERRPPPARERARDPRENASRSSRSSTARAREIRHSVVFATVIVALVFLPLFMLSSVEGRLLRPLGFAYVVALTASLIVALTVTPVLCSWLLPQSRLIASGTEPRLTRRLKARLRALARPCVHVLAHRADGRGRRSVGRRARRASCRAGRSFLPEFNEGALTVSAVTIPGTSLADSNALGNALERLLLSVPEVTSTARRTGRAELDEHVQGVESAEIDVRLEMKDRPREAVLEELRQKVSLLPGHQRHDRPADLAPHRPHAVRHAGEHRRQDLSATIYQRCGSSPARFTVEMAQVAGVVDLATEPQTDIPTLKVRVDPAAAARQGLESGTVAEALQTARVGHAVGQILAGSDRLSAGRALRPGRLDGARRDRQRRRSRRPTGARFRCPLSPRFRRIAARTSSCARTSSGGSSCRATSPDATCAASSTTFRRASRQNVKLPQGYHVEYGGQFESEAQASTAAALAVAGRRRRDLLHPLGGVRLVA